MSCQTTTGSVAARTSTDIKQFADAQMGLACEGRVLLSFLSYIGAINNLNTFVFIKYIILIFSKKMKFEETYLLIPCAQDLLNPSKHFNEVRILKGFFYIVT